MEGKVIQKNNYSSLKEVLEEDEFVVVKEKPNKKAFIMSSVFALMPFVLIWLVFDLFFVFAFFLGVEDIPVEVLFIFVPFMIVHLTPVWLWLAGIIKAYCGYENQLYILTNKRVIIQSGIKKLKFTSVPYSYIIDVQVKPIRAKSDSYNIFIQRQGTVVSIAAVENPFEFAEKIRYLQSGKVPDIIHKNEDSECCNIKNDDGLGKLSKKELEMMDKRDNAVNNIFNKK